MQIQIPPNASSIIVPVFIGNSTVTTGAGLGSLIHTSSIAGGYVRDGETGVALAVNQDVATEGTYQAPSTVGQVRIGTPANGRTGTYELHFHNDLWIPGPDRMLITLGGATNMRELQLFVELLATAATPVDVENVATQHTVLPQRAQPIADIPFTMLNGSTGLPLPGLTGIVAERRFDGALTWTAVNASSTITEAANGDYDFHPVGIDTDGDVVRVRMTHTSTTRPTNFTIRTRPA